MLVAPMLLQLIKTRISLPFVTSTTLGAAGDVAEMILNVSVFGLNMAVAVGFTAKRGVAPLTGVAARNGGVDEAICKVGGYDVPLPCIDRHDKVHRAGKVLPLMDRGI